MCRQVNATVVICRQVSEVYARACTVVDVISGISQGVSAGVGMEFAASLNTGVFFTVLRAVIWASSAIRRRFQQPSNASLRIWMT